MRLSVLEVSLLADFSVRIELSVRAPAIAVFEINRFDELAGGEKVFQGAVNFEVLVARNFLDLFLFLVVINREPARQRHFGHAEIIRGDLKVHEVFLIVLDPAFFGPQRDVGSEPTECKED